MTGEQVLAAVRLKRLRCAACRGPLQVDGESPEFRLAEAGLKPIPLSCFWCGRNPAGPAEPERTLPPPIPLTGVCVNGHSRAVHGWYSKDERTVSGYARRCAKCGEQNGAASRIRNNERGGGWNGRAVS